MNTTPFHVYNASAGSGKTYTLVQKYLEACFSSKTPFQNILAITFTNKAAAEMKNRVIKALKELAAKEGAGKDTSLFAYFQAKMNWTEEMLAQKSADLLEEILHDYSSFSISTIDKFTHRIVRSFAMDLHLPLNFEVVMDQDKMIDEIVDSLIAKAGTDKELTKLLLDFMETKADDDASWDPKKPLASMAKRLFEEGSDKPLKLLKDIKIEDWKSYGKKVREELNALSEEITRPAKDILDFMRDNDIAKDAFHSKGAGTYSFFENILAGKFYDGFARAKGCLAKGVWHKPAADGADRVEAIAEDLNRAAAGIFAAIEKNKSSIATLTMADKNLFAVAMLNELSKLLASQKEQGQYLHISDFNKIISENIQDQPAPFLYERLGEKYQHYFIDEFQDTSLQQWKNLEPLISNALAYEDGACMLVGDGKQAI
jgi:ATP-dependent exoDNAse (exonuclease V) beta subunit